MAAAEAAAEAALVSQPPRKRARSDFGATAEVPEKSPNDKLEYRLLSFANGFEALLVSCDDAKKNKAAAAVSVAAGSFSDPAGRCEGLAHYLEHMLFMGSAKYPGEDEMENFLTKNGGYSNAFTESAHTCYYLEVNKAELHTALDMLGQFFVAPLLKTDSAERELGAIDSEFRLTQNSDSSRVAQLFAHYARPGHPFRIFGWGNRQSLAEAPKKAGVDINEELRKFHAKYYRASRLRLSVFGVEPLDALEEAVFAAFDGLPPTPAAEMAAGRGPQEALLAAAGMPFAPEALPQLLRVRPVKDTHKLSLAWQLPPSQHLYRTKPLHYVQHLVGHEGAGSLLSWLKQQGIATSLTAGVSDDDFESNSMCSIFTVDMTLTAKGLERWPDAAHATFLYLDMMRQAGPQEWVHEELNLTHEMGWRFLEESNPTDYVQYLSHQLLPEFEIERRLLLKANWMTPEWDPSAITAFLSHMLPERCVMDVLSSAYGRAKGAKASGDAEGEEEEEVEAGDEGDDKAEADGGDDGDEGDEEEGDEEGEEEEREGDKEEDAEADLEAGQVASAKDPSFDLATAGPPSVEPLFGTEFWEAPRSELDKLLSVWKAEPADGSSMAEAKRALRFPDRNRFIATDFDVRAPPGGGEALPEGDLASVTPEALRKLYASFPPLPSPLPPRPQRLPATVGGRAWHLQDTVFRTPRSELWLKLSTDEAPLNPNDATSHVLLTLLGRVLADALNETAYLAEQASLHLRISTQSYGLDVCAGGFSHKLPVLLDAGLRECLAFGDPREWERRLQDQTFRARLQAQTEQLLRIYRNAYLKPGDHAADLRRLLLMPHRQAAPDRARALQALDEQSLASFAQALLPKLRAEVLLTGNATRAEAEQLVRSLPPHLLGEAEAMPRHPPLTVARVPQGKATVMVEDSFDSGSRVSAVELYWQLGVASEEDFKDRVVVDVLEAIMSEPLFDALRTKQQLGYVASCGIRVTQWVLGFSIWLLSSKVGPAEICRRVEAFLPEFRQRLADLPAEDFERHVSSLAAHKLEPDRTLLSVQDGAFAELQERRSVFDRYYREAVSLASVTKEDVMAVLDSSIMPGAGGRRLLVVAVIGGRAKAKRAAEVEAFRKDYPGCWHVTSQADFLAGTALFDHVS